MRGLCTETRRARGSNAAHVPRAGDVRVAVATGVGRVGRERLSAANPRTAVERPVARTALALRVGRCQHGNSGRGGRTAPRSSLLSAVASRHLRSGAGRGRLPPRGRALQAPKGASGKGKALHVPYFCRIAGAAFGSIRICSLLALQSKTLTGRETSRREPRTRYLRAFFIRSGLWRGMMRCVRLFRFIYRIYSQLGRIKRVKTSSPKESGRAEGPRAPASPSPLPCGPSGPCPVMVYGLWNGYTPVVQMSGMGSGSGKRMQKRAIQHA